MIDDDDDDGDGDDDNIDDGQEALWSRYDLDFN